MKDSDRTEFCKVWLATLGVYGKPIDPTSAEIVFAVLKRYDIGTIRQALSAHLADTESGQYPPKPADIIRQIEGGADVRALKAWTKVEDAIRRVGSWGSLVFDDPAIHCCIEDMGGWMPFAAVTNDELPFLRNNFTKRYQGYIGRPLTRWPRMLPGEGHTEYHKFIGNIEECQTVLNGGDGGQNYLTKNTSVSGMLADAMKQLTGDKP